MGEFDESNEDETVDTSESFDDTSSDIEDSSDDSSNDTYEEDIDDSSYDEQAEAKANAEYAEQQAEAEAEANAEYAEDQIDESELSPAELRERAEQEAKEAQDEAEQWADENNMDTWSDGTPRQNYENTEEEVTDVATSLPEDTGDASPSSEAPISDDFSESSTDSATMLDGGLENNEEGDESPIYQEEFGNAGPDPYASYPESHVSETDEQYLDEEGEMTAATNDRANRELREFERLQANQTNDENVTEDQESITEEEALQKANEAKARIAEYLNNKSPESNEHKNSASSMTFTKDDYER